MFETTVRKIGNSVAVTIPAEFKIQANKTFIISRTGNGGLVLVPKSENPLELLPGDFEMSDEFETSLPSGREVI